MPLPPGRHWSGLSGNDGAALFPTAAATGAGDDVPEFRIGRVVGSTKHGPGSRRACATTSHNWLPNLQPWCMANDLASRLRSRQWQEVQGALYEAFEHPDGDRLLAEFVVAAKPGPERVSAAALLGELRGSEGTAALRQLIRATGPGSRDLRCVSLIALAKRCGEEASADLTEALFNRDSTVKDYATLGLAGAGDGRAWDLVRRRGTLTG